jgi:hypothetical protein
MIIRVPVKTSPIEWIIESMEVPIDLNFRFQKGYSDLYASALANLVEMAHLLPFFCSFGAIVTIPGRRLSDLEYSISTFKNNRFPEHQDYNTYNNEAESRKAYSSAEFKKTVTYKISNDLMNINDNFFYKSIIIHKNDKLKDFYTYDDHVILHYTRKFPDPTNRGRNGNKDLQPGQDFSYWNEKFDDELKTLIGIPIYLRTEEIFPLSFLWFFCFKEIDMTSSINFLVHLNNWLNDLSSLCSLLFVPLSINYINNSINYLKTESLKSAIAAIMARNGSHNIGSHILSNISHKVLNPLDVLFLIKYIQQRWDFLAQVASPDWPKWTLPMRFKGQIMRGFYEQRLLLNNIAESEGLAAREDFGTHADLRNKISFEIKIFDGDGDPKEGDIALAIPGGITGVHAFYSILENIIRNTAKHAYKKKEDDGIGLKISIDVTDDSNNDYVEFFVSDNWTKNKPLVDENKKKATDESSVKPTIDDECKDSSTSATADGKKDGKPKDIKELIENAIKEFLIQDDGSLNYENWGIAEMKISAVYLRKKDIQELNPPKDKDFIFRIEKNDKDIEVPKGTIAFEEHQGKLVYHFAIPKPKEVGVEDSTLKVEYRKHGIYKIDSSEEWQDDFDFVIGKLKKKESENAGGNNSGTQNENPPHQLIAARGGNEILRYIDGSHPFDENLLNKANPDENKKLYPVQLAKLELFDERLKKLIDAKEQEGKDAKIEKITLVINPFEETKSKSFVNEEEIWKYYAHNIGSHFGPIAGIETDEWDKQKIKEFFDKNAEELSKDPWVTFSGSFNKKYEDLFNKLLISKKTIGQNYAKYEEDIETLPNEYLKKKTKNSDGWIKSVKKEIVKPSLKTLESRVEIVKDIPDNDKDHTIVYKRHFKPTGNYKYAEALSGSQSYFNLILSPPEDDYSKMLLIYELLETALIPIEIVDERMEQYVNSSPQIEARLNSLGVVVRQQSAKEEGKAPKYYKKLIDLKPLPDHRNTLLIIHHGMLQKHSNDTHNTIDEILGGLTNSYGTQNIFVTTGKGQADITTGYKYLPFADVRSALMKPFPEKFILMKTLMKITPKPEKDGTS